MGLYPKHPNVLYPISKVPLVGRRFQCPFFPTPNYSCNVTFHNRLLFGVSCIMYPQPFFVSIGISGELYCSSDGSCGIRGGAWGIVIICRASPIWPSKGASSWGAKISIRWRRLSLSSWLTGEYQEFFQFHLIICPPFSFKFLFLVLHIVFSP